MSIEIKDHNKSKRVKIIKLKEQDLEKIIFPFKKHSITSLEYKPFSRFSLAKSLDEVFENKLGSSLTKVLNDSLERALIVSKSTLPSVIYGIKNFDGNLTKKHLKTNNVYNSYLNFGLPPTPISNPSLNAIKASANPDKHKFLYFVIRFLLHLYKKGQWIKKILFFLNKRTILTGHLLSF